jgi:site-specific recombinase XerD
MEEYGLLTKNPTRGILIPPQAVLAPRVLSRDQRQVLREVVERECEDKGDLRGVAAFSLGYWAGCRVSDVSWLLMDNLHVTAKAGWMIVGHKGGKQREIDLTNEARRALLDYLTAGKRKESVYVFTSQRAKQRLARGEIDGWRWSEDGMHVWWQAIKAKARRAEAELIGDVTFHDLRHDFAHRAREAGWSLEEVAYYLGHITKAGTPAIQTTIRYTQVSREQVKDKLKTIKG